MKQLIKEQKIAVKPTSILHTIATRKRLGISAAKAIIWRTSVLITIADVRAVLGQHQPLMWAFVATRCTKTQEKEGCPGYKEV